MLKPQSTNVISPVMPLASGITGEITFVDCGFNITGV